MLRGGKSKYGIIWPDALRVVVKELPRYYQPVAELPQHLGQLLRKMNRSRSSQQQQQQPQPRSDDNPS